MIQADFLGKSVFGGASLHENLGQAGILFRQASYKLLSVKKASCEEIMDITLVYKVIGVGIIVMFSGLVLDRADRKEQSLLVSVAGIVAVLLMLVDKLSELFEKIRYIFGI